jgi:putative phosphoserine phosphatase / 1-acylglycerol-3-phosphate O-acyltransferase
VINVDKVVFTDIDGTLINGFSSVEFVNFLYQKQFISDSFFEQHKKLISKFNLGEISFDDGVKKWLDLLNNGFIGKKYVDVNCLANEFFIEYKNNMLPSSKELISFLKDKGYYIVGISNGLFEINSLIKAELGIDELFSSIIKKKGGRYVKGFLTNTHLIGGKKDVVFDFSLRNNISLKKCIGFGDSIQDFGFLSIMGLPVALNPNCELYSLAKKKNFLIANHGDVLRKIKVILN